MRKPAIGILALLIAIPLTCGAQQPAYLDPVQPTAKRVDDLISRLSKAEKISLLSTTAPAIPRLKVPAMNGWNQSLHGVVWTRPTTMFPVPISMAATWNPKLVKEVAGAIADEGRAIYNYWPTIAGKVELTGGEGQAVTVTADGERFRHNGLVYRSPVVNMDRDPRWGRIWEAFGEDPLLASRMTVAYVRGTQGNDPKYLELAATLKHYAVYNQERDRLSSIDSVDERSLREYYLPQFRAGIVEAHAESIMSSYNGIYGIPNAENAFLLKDVLRGEWGFEGFVVPDSGAVELLVTAHRKYKTIEEAAAKTILAGSDLDNGAYALVLPRALAEGLLTENDIDRALRRVLTVRFKLGEFDPPSMVPYSKLGPEVIDSEQHRELAHKLAQESIVLLRNRDNFLPLSKSKFKTIAVIGPFADYAQTGPNYTGLYSSFVKPLQGIENKVGAGTKVRYARGSGIMESDNPEASYTEAESVAAKADAAVLFVGINQMLEREAIDREYLNLPPVQMQLVRRVLKANPKTVLVLVNGGPVSLAPPRFAADTRAGEAPAVLDMFWAGEEGGNAIADVLFGDYNPGAKLPYTVYRSERELPPMTEYDITKGFTYMYFDGKPLYAFGHGLSYTNFSYGNLEIPSGQIPGKGSFAVKADVENTGQRAGDEVVQLYVHAVSPAVTRPREQLAGFERISLKPGEKGTVEFSVPVERLSYWDTKKQKFVVTPGAFDIMVGSASDDLRLKGRLQVTSPGEWPPSSAPSSD